VGGGRRRKVRQISEKGEKMKIEKEKGNNKEVKRERMVA
jgi:hypothetical protein